MVFRSICYDKNCAKYELVFNNYKNIDILQKENRNTDEQGYVLMLC